MDDLVLFRYRSDKDYAINAFLEQKTYAVAASLLNDPMDVPLFYSPSVLSKLLVKNDDFVNEYRNATGRRTGPSIDKMAIISSSDFSDFIEKHIFKGD